MVALSLLRLVAVTLVVVLSGTPTVAAACAALCAPRVSAGSAGHHASDKGVHHAPDAGSRALLESGSVSPAEDQHHHHDGFDTQDMAEAPVAGSVASLRPATAVAAVRDCCSDLEGVTCAPARVQSRDDIGAPLVATSTPGAGACATRASAAHDPPVSPPPPLAPVRSPLILRI